MPTLIPALRLGPEKSLPKIENLKALFEQYVDRERLEGYRLPVGNTHSRIIVGLSGGADSSVLAIFSALYLAPHYPSIEFVFTDTKAEPDSCYETLDAIEVLTGIPIQRISPEKGLFELIDQNKGFLPSSQARWCTRELKVSPLVKYMRSVPSDQGYVSLAGIRFDEADREGIQFQYTMENAGAAFPFIDLEITRRAVFDILDQSIGIPKTYQYRSRSGCFSCFFQRNQEAIGMLLQDPKAYAKTEAAEKLSTPDRGRWTNMPPTLSDVGIRGYYPVPAFIDIRKPDTTPEKAPQKLRSNRVEGMGDLFDSENLASVMPGDDVFAAFALYTDAALGVYGGREFTPGVYWQEFVTVSTSLPGIKSALSTYYSFKQTTPMPTYDVQDMVIVIAQLRFPKGVIDTAPPSKESYTWKSGVSFKQLRHLALNCISTLQYTDLERQLNDALQALRSAKSGDAALDAAERLECVRKALHRAPAAPGRLIWEGLYIPSPAVKKEVQLQLAGVSIESNIKRARENLEYDEVPAACLACSV